MKALTNILTRLLMLLLLMLVACTEDTAEVDDLVRGEEYVQVRMHVPGMKNATTRANEAEDNLTSVVVLVFRNDALVSKTEVTTASSTLTTTTFNIPRPKVNDVIHFLGNVPNGVTLPDVGAEESVLCNLETGDRENLSYWGKVKYTGTDIDVNLYRHLAKIEIAPDPNECTFPEDELFIAGLVNANTKGKLVPYDEENGAFNFDLSDENYGGNYDYCTVPAEPNPLEETPLLDNNGAGFKNWLYVFEHDNPDAYTEANKDNFFCVICKIGKYYYKVALTSDGETPYDIIRNHRYVIYVKDLDEVVYNIPDNITEEKEIENYKYQQALTSDPINLEIKVEKEVALSIAEQNISLPYSTTAQEEVTLSVTVPADVASLSVRADGFTVTSGDSKMTNDNGVYSIKDTSTEQTVRFKLRLNNDEEDTHSVTISGIGVNEFVTVVDATTTITTTPYSTNVANEHTLWLGSVSLDNTDNQTQIPVPYSLFSGQNSVPEGSKLFIEYEGSDGWIQAATPNSGGDWAQLPGYNVVNNPIAVAITDEVLAQISEHHSDDVAFYVQGNGGKTLKKIYLVRANGAITATKANDNPLYHNADNQSITVTATVPEGVSTLYITAPDFNFSGDTDGDYTYALNNGQTTVQLEFTLKQDVDEVKTSTIKFSGDYVSSTTIDVAIAELDIPDVSITSTSNTTLYWNDGNPTSFDVTVSVPELGGCSLNQLNIAADGFTIRQGDTTLGTNSYTDNNSRAAGTTITYTFTPTGTGNGKTIVFTGSGTMVDVHQTSFTINVPTITASVDDNKTELYYNVENQTVTVTATIPTGVSAISIEAPDFSVALNNGNGGALNGTTFTCNGATTAKFVFTLNSGIESSKASTITFKDAAEGNKVGSASVNIDLIEQTETPTGLTITPISSTTTIDLAEGGNKTVQLRITQPDGFKISQIQTNYAFDIVGINGTASPSENGPTHYYYNPVGSNSIDLEFTVNDGIWGIAGEFTIKFISNSQSVSTTITVVNSGMSSNILWQGSVAVNRRPILRGSLINYVGKKLRVLIQTPDNNGWRQFIVKKRNGYNETEYIKFDDQNVLKQNVEVALDIPLPTTISDFPEQLYFEGNSDLIIKELKIVD